MRTLILGILLFLLWVPNASASFAYMGTVTIKNDATEVPSTQTNLDIIVTDTNAVLKSTGNGGYVTDAQGDDIVFKSASDCASGTLSYKLLSWNAATGLFRARVKIPSLAAAGLFYICIGDATITTFQGGATGSEFASDVKGHWDFSDGTTLTVTDSTSNANDGTNSGMTATTGQVNGGAASDGGSHFVDVGSSASLNPANDMTIVAWGPINTVTTTAPMLVTRDNSGVGQRAYYLSQAFNAAKVFGGILKSDIGESTATGATTLTPATVYMFWLTYHFVSDGASVLKIGFNATLDATNSSAVGPIQSASQRTQIGVRDYSGFTFPWTGMIDEPSIMDSAWSLDRLTVKYYNEKTSSDLLSYSYAAVAGSATPSRLGLLGVGH